MAVDLGDTVRFAGSYRGRVFGRQPLGLFYHVLGFWFNKMAFFFYSKLADVGLMVRQVAANEAAGPASRKPPAAELGQVATVCE